MNEAIIFLDSNFVKTSNEESNVIRTIKSVYAVLRELKLEPQQLYDALKEWKKEVHSGQKEYMIEIEPMKWLYISWDTENLNYFFPPGYLALKRPWGNHFRYLDFPPQQFSVEMVI